MERYGSRPYFFIAAGLRLDTTRPSVTVIVHWMALLGK